MPCKRCVVALSARSEPLTVKPRFSSTSAMPLIPEPPIPTKWICLTLCRICQLLAYASHHLRCLWLAQRTCLARHVQQGFASEISHQLCQLLRRQFSLRNEYCRAFVGQIARISSLMVIHRVRKRHQHASH